MHKEELIKFWKSSASASGSTNVMKYSSTLRDGVFFLHNLAHISWESHRILMKFLSQMHPWTRKSLLNFGSNPDPHSGRRKKEELIKFWKSSASAYISAYTDSVCRPHSPWRTYAVFVISCTGSTASVLVTWHEQVNSGYTCQCCDGFTGRTCSHNQSSVITSGRDCDEQCVSAADMLHTEYTEYTLNLVHSDTL